MATPAPSRCIFAACVRRLRAIRRTHVTSRPSGALATNSSREGQTGARRIYGDSTESDQPTRHPAHVERRDTATPARERALAPAHVRRASANLAAAGGGHE